MAIWRNWSSNVEVQPHRIHEPKTVKDVQDLVKEALRLGRHVHAVGRGWSLSDVAATTDFLVDTRGLRGILAFSQGSRVWGHRIRDRHRVDDPHVEDDPIPDSRYQTDRSWALIDALRDDTRATDRRFAHVLAGTTLRELIEALDGPAHDRAEGAAGIRGQWALPTMGGASGQTIVGAISTGTHGGDFDLPPLADCVRALHLVAADGTQRWIEPATGRITDPERLARAQKDIPPERLHYDDDMFAAALVSLGTLGVIVSVILEVRAQFSLNEVVHPETNWASLRRQLLDGSLFGDGPGDPPWLAAHPKAPCGGRSPKSLSVFINPYRSSGNYSSGDGHAERSVTLVTCAEASCEGKSGNWIGRERDKPPEMSRADMFHVITSFEAAHNLKDTAAAVQRVVSLLRPKTNSADYWVAWSVLDTTSSTDLPVLSLEIVVSTAQNKHVALLDEMFARFDAIMRQQWAAGIATKFAGMLNLRFTRPTRALLGMQAGSGANNERFCHIEIPIVKEIDALGSVHQGHKALENNSELFVKAWEELLDRFGARLHWGQYSIGDAHRAAGYPGRERFLKVRDRLTQNGTLHAFDSAFSVRAGLVRMTPNWEIRGGMVPAPPPTQAPSTTTDEARTAPTVMMNRLTGCNELFVIAGDNQVARCRQLSVNGGWGTWELLPHQPRFVGRPAAVTDENTTYVFARTADGQLFQTNSPARSGAWGNGSWGHFRGNRVAGSPVAIVDLLHGWPYVFVRSADGRIRCVTLSRADTRPGHFGDWETLPELSQRPAGDPALAIGTDGLIEVYVRSADGGVWMLAQPRDKGWNWSGTWRKIGTVRLAGDPVVLRHHDGRLELFGRGADSRLWHTWQERAGGPWAAWQLHGKVDYTLAQDMSLGGHAHASGGVAVALRDSGGRAHVVSFGHGQRWHDTRLSDDARSTVSPLALGASRDGRLELFSKASHDLITHRWERRLGEW
jgi:hypothetical protein